MPLYIGDYLADTSRLTTEQHGAYLLLIMDYWRNGSLPDNDEVLASIVRLPVERWKKHRGAISGYFTPMDGRWRHARVESEKKRTRDIQKKRKEAGIKGAAIKYGKGIANG